MGVAYNSRPTTDGLIFAIDAANPRSYKRENLLTSWGEYLSGASGSKYQTSGNNITLFNNSYNEWIVYAIAPDVTASDVGKRLVCSFDYYTDEGTVSFRVDNDGAGDNQILASLTANTTRQVFTDHADLGGTGVVRVYLRRESSSTATLYIKNFQLWYEEAPIDVTVNANQSYEYNKSYIIWNGDNKGYWQFNANPGSSAYSSVPFIRFSPTNGLEDLNGSSYSVTAWINWTGLEVPGDGVANIFSPRGSAAAESTFSIFHDGNKLYFDRYYPSGGGAITTNLTVPTNQWIFVAMSATHSSNVRFFVNTDVEQVAHTETYAGGTPTEVNIGSQTSNGGQNYSRQFDGKIANMHVYNRALTDEEVLRNYHAFKGRFGV
jgi:hypothetical protein